MSFRPLSNPPAPTVPMTFPLPVEIADATPAEMTTPRFRSAVHNVEAACAAQEKRIRKWRRRHGRPPD